MSDLEQACQPSDSRDCPRAAHTPVSERIATRDAVLGEGMTIRRALPSRARRMIGAWCFLDHFGPLDTRGGEGLRVGPHPHTCLQTFTWPLDGEILHRDSLGYVQPIRPGQVNLMTAGYGISHSEESPTERSALLHGAQLWIALPAAERHREPAFEHYPELPVVERDGFSITVLVGDAYGERAPTRVYSPLAAFDLQCAEPAATKLTLRPDFEYGALVLDGEAELDGGRLSPGCLLYLGCGREHLALRGAAGVRLLVIGGEPFGDEILMWWNFVGRDRDEITRAVTEWNTGAARFGEVRGYPGARLTAPLPPWAAG
jgi:redox-sensitive bicupin YhaK (pirin superfamily)